MHEAQQRVVQALGELSQHHQGEHIAIVSHGDVIKAALMHYLRIPLDHILQFEISPASVSVVTLHGPYSQVIVMNDTGEYAGHPAKRSAVPAFH